MLINGLLVFKYIFYCRIFFIFVFSKILTFDKNNEQNQIIAVRISKPTIPKAIVENFERREAEKSRLNVAIEAQRVAEKEAETQRMRQRIEAETRAEVIFGCFYLKKHTYSFFLKKKKSKSK